MRWILYIAAYVRYLLWGSNHKKRGEPFVFEDEFIGYEAFSSQCYCRDLTPKSKRTVQG